MVAGGCPAGEPPPGETRDFPFGVDAASSFGQMGKTRRVRGRVHHFSQARDGGHQRGDDGQPAHGVVGGGAKLPGVVMGEELGLIGRYVDAHRAFLAAGLAGQAQVQGVTDLPGMPAAGHHLPAYHLHQQPGPAPGGVLFLAGDAVARAHHTALVAAAFPDPHAAGRGAGELALVVRILEQRPRLRRVPPLQRQVSRTRGRTWLAKNSKAPSRRPPTWPRYTSSKAASW
jgi:hypothetical protein